MKKKLSLFFRIQRRFKSSLANVNDALIPWFISSQTQATNVVILWFLSNQTQVTNVLI